MGFRGDEMTDRELLEPAAKAAGYVIESFTEDGVWVYEAGSSKNVDGEYPIFLWRPRHDDGDALRLAHKLRLLSDVEVWPMTLEATRRAIVQAAAEIGKEMKNG
jgi:hypothetical protein